ncbi:MAG: response regulator, partial [Limnobacter sp.]|nr:response regulator [Limnobacter sp.]
MSKTILIVDDSTSLRQVVSMTLKSQGYEVLEGCDGKDALTKLDGRKVHL